MKKLTEQTKSVKHTFTPEEMAQIDVEFHQAFSDVKAIKDEAKSSASLYKSKINAAESMQSTLHAKRQAGFEHRDKKCVIQMDPTKGKKSYFLFEDVSLKGEIMEGREPVLVESMTEDDYQIELVQAESEFDSRREVQLYEAGEDEGVLVVGKLAGKWFAAIRANVGPKKFEERLDNEQPASKQRGDAVKRALKRFEKWLESSLSRDVAQGFKNQLALVESQEVEKAE